MRCIETTEGLTWDAGAPWEKAAIVLVFIPLTTVFLLGLPPLVIAAVLAGMVGLSMLALLHSRGRYRIADRVFLLEHRFYSLVWKTRRLPLAEVAGLTLSEMRKETYNRSVYYEYTIGLKTVQGEIVPTASSRLVRETLAAIDRLRQVTGLPLLPHEPLRNPQA